MNDTRPDAAAVVREAIVAMLSKLEWAKLGGSTRHIDNVNVRALLRINADCIDMAYLEHWLDVLGVRAQWEWASKVP